jgi:predicted AlkP superfamily pyrophosphatase or phosphodiesterase
MMIRHFSGFVAAALGATACVAPAQTPTKPKLIVVISVDQFSADLFNEYRSHFTGGLKRLTQGAVFANGFQSHAATETCPGHATILTGVHSGRAGVIANNWIDQRIARADKGVYCAEDETLGKSSRPGDYVPATVHLKVPTLGDRMKDASPASRVVAVAGKDRAAIMMGGHKTDAIWFLNPRDSMSFETLRGKPMMPVVERANTRLAAAFAKPVAAMPMSPFCASLARPVTIAGVKVVGNGRFARDASDKAKYRSSPEPDGAVIGLAGDLIADMKLGQGPATDLIAIGASATDFIGHAYGTGGSEMCIQLTALDAQLGALFKRLDAAKIDYAVALTADHGGHDAPERNDENAAPDAMRVNFDPGKISTDVAKSLNLTGGVLVAADPTGDLTIAASVPPALRSEAIARVKKSYEAQAQVQAVFTKDELKATPLATTPPDSWSLAERARASFDPDRSGDLVVLLKPRVTPIPDIIAARSYIATHGSPWDYDRRVPILFWRKGMAGFEQPNSIDTVDIAPTLAAMIGMTVPAGEFDGKCRDLVAGKGSSCPEWYIGLDSKPKN